MRLPIPAVRIISFPALALAVLASAVQAEATELTDAHMDQITAGGLFELAADQLDMTTSAPVGPIGHNVIGGVGMLLEEFLSEAFSSPQSFLRSLAMRDLASEPQLNSGSPLPNALPTTPLPNALPTTPLPNARTT
jgi:hypothetical protein